MLESVVSKVSKFQKGVLDTNLDTCFLVKSSVYILMSKVSKQFL